MHSPPPSPSPMEREALDEALFCTGRSFDPAELPVYLPPVPPRVGAQIHYALPDFYRAAPSPDLDYPLPPRPANDEPARDACGSVSDSGGSFEMMNLAPGLYEVRQSPPAVVLPDPEPAPAMSELQTETARATPESLSDSSEVLSPCTQQERDGDEGDILAADAPFTGDPSLPCEEARGVSLTDSQPELAPSKSVPPSLRIEVNAGLTVAPGETARVGADVLQIAGAESPFLIDLMLLSPPIAGVLLRDGFALTGGDIFTQEDIDGGRISYRHEGESAEASDHFSFATPDGEIPPTRVEIQVVVRHRAPRLTGAGTLDEIARGMAASTILDDRADADGECGLAVTGIAGSGTWAWSPDEGKTWRPLGDIKPSSALLLGPGNRLRFAPRPGSATIARLTYRAWDLSSHESGGRADLSRHEAVGGTTAFSVEVTTATLRIEPALVPAKRPAAEPWKSPLTGTGLIGGGVAIVRLAGPGTWQFTVDGSTWRACQSVYHGRALLLPAHASIRFVPLPEASGKVSIVLRSWDGDSVGRANLAPRDSVGEGTAFGATVESWNWSIGEK